MLVTEQVAITIYATDQYSEAAPSIGDPLRCPYPRWLVYDAACFEPAVADRAEKREPLAIMMSPHGDFDGPIQALAGQLWSGPFRLVPKRRVFTDVSPISARPVAARARDAALAAAQDVAGVR